MFFTGCNLNCPFCYNKHVVNGEGNFSINDVIEKKTQIENCFNNFKIGMVFSGGEPTIQNKFEDIINTFVNDHPLAIHTNGIIIPNFKNCFESVVLSLKFKECGIPENYVDILRNALYYYKECKQKEINVVKVKNYLDEYTYYLNELKEDIDNLGYKVIFSNNIKEGV